MVSALTKEKHTAKLSLTEKNEAKKNNKQNKTKQNKTKTATTITDPKIFFSNTENRNSFLFWCLRSSSGQTWNYYCRRHLAVEIRTAGIGFHLAVETETT